MTTKDLIESCKEGYGWAALSYILENTDDPDAFARKVINDMYANNKINILTVKQVRLEDLHLQEFEELIGTGMEMELIILM
jgi:hypothetical protein